MTCRPCAASGRAATWTRATALQLLTAEDQRGRLVVERSQDRARFLMALEREGLLPEGAGIHPVSMPDITPACMLAIHAYLARTPARMLVVQPEDIFGVVEQVNLPGSRDDQHPNWRRRLPLDLDDWRDDERFAAIGELMRRERGSAVAPHEKESPPARLAIIPRATYRLQFNREFSFQAGDRAGALSGRTRRQPLLRLALPQGAAGQQPWLRHRRSRRAQSGNRHAAGLR